MAWCGCSAVHGWRSLGLAQSVIVLPDIAENEIRPLDLECQAYGPAGTSLPDPGRALDTLDPQSGVSQILSHQAKCLLDSLSVFGREGAICPPESLREDQARQSGPCSSAAMSSSTVS
jgi:hypothetical protein